MADQIAPNKRKIINWNKKSGADAERISKRLEGRENIEDRNATTNDAFSAPKPAARPAVGAPLLRLRKKIKEVYDEEDDEEDAPFFNIGLLNETERQQQEKSALETIRITKEQQLAGKLSVIMSSSMAARAAGLPAQPTAEDAQLANSAEFDVKKLRRQTLRQKVEKPLKLKGSLPEKQLAESLEGLKLARKTLPDGLLADFPAEDAAALAGEREETGMAKLILEKSGRKAPKKKIIRNSQRLEPI